MYGKPNFLIFLLRLSLGWLFFYSGLTKVMDKTWTAKPFLEAAKTWPELFGWLASPDNIGWVNLVNSWGQLLIGAALILGIFVGVAAFAGFLLMLLYYLPILDFPRVGEHGYLVDEHIIYALALVLLIRLRAGRFFGLSWFFGRSVF